MRESELLVSRRSLKRTHRDLRQDFKRILPGKLNSIRINFYSILSLVCSFCKVFISNNPHLYRRCMKLLQKPNFKYMLVKSNKGLKNIYHLNENR